MKNYSLWKDLSSNKDARKLNKDLDVDVLIIGGGITGVSCLYNLSQTNLNVVLLEQNKCGYGVTANSTAKISYLQEKMYMNIRKYSEDKAFNYLKSQIYAKDKLKNIISEENIDCNLEEVKSYIFTNDEANIHYINEEYMFLKKAHVNVKRIKKLDVDIPIKLGLEVSDTFEFNPIKYINHFKNKFYSNIYENSKVNSIDKEKDYYICKVGNFKVKAKYVIIATHYLNFLKPLMMPINSYIEKSFIGAKVVNDFKNISMINIDNPCISLRYHREKDNNYLIYLNGSYKTGDINDINDCFTKLENKDNFLYEWSNHDIITNDYIPYIGSISDDKKIFMASGYNTWGFTNSTLAGEIITDIILNKDNPYIKLMSPNRGINLSKVMRFPIDVSNNIKSFIKSENSVNNNRVINKRIKGDKVLIYKDDEGTQHIVYNRCPHLKCGIVFNEKEKTWDCLCHGSRFDIDGKCINGPSNYDISYKKDNTI
ncbi:MAG: FAD-dependent oxidoreductase [Ruminococcus sp.]|nr:FAD-dependent oxidoreductase [Ruminococcus sp.]